MGDGELSVFGRVCRLLDGAGSAYVVSRHEPVYTSEEAARVRGAALASGAKAIVLKAGERFVMCVVPADRKLDGKKLKATLGVKSTRFADRDELLRLTGLEPGALPPFGSLFGLPCYVDPALGDAGAINFNAGDHAVSVRMTWYDYLKAEKPELAAVT